MKTLLLATMFAATLGTAALAEDTTVNDLSAVLGASSVELNQPFGGQYTWGLGVSGVYSEENEYAAGLGGGLAYGITDQVNLYAKAATSFAGKSTAIFLGVSGSF